VDDNTADILGTLMVLGFFAFMVWIAYKAGSED
jgi:cbb3-type cytochrome oxidase subunit 3